MYIRFAAEKITLAPGKWQMVFKNAQGQQLPIEPCAFESSAIVAYRRIVDEFPQVAEVSPKRIYKCLNFKNPFNLKTRSGCESIDGPFSFYNNSDRNTLNPPSTQVVFHAHFSPQDGRDLKTHYSV